MFERGNKKPKKMETNKFSPVNPASKYHKVAASLCPKNPIIMYHVRAKPHISTNKATKNAK